MKYYLICLMLASGIFACSGPQQPEFQTLKNVKFKAGTLSGDIILTADALFNNPNPIGINLNQMDLDVYIDGKKVTNVKQNINTTIKGNRDFTLPLEVEVPIVKVFEEAKGGALLAILKNRKATVKVDGAVKISMAGIGRSIPVDYEDEYKLTIGLQ